MADHVGVGDADAGCGCRRRVAGTWLVKLRCAPTGCGTAGLAVPQSDAVDHPVAEEPVAAVTARGLGPLRRNRPVSSGGSAPTNRQVEGGEFVGDRGVVAGAERTGRRSRLAGSW